MKRTELKSMLIKEAFHTPRPRYIKERIGNLFVKFWSLFHMVFLITMYYAYYKVDGWTYWDAFYHVFHTSTALGMSPNAPRKNWYPLLAPFVWHSYAVCFGKCLVELESIEQSMREQLSTIHKEILRKGTIHAKKKSLHHHLSAAQEIAHKLEVAENSENRTHLEKEMKERRQTMKEIINDIGIL